MPPFAAPSSPLRSNSPTRIQIQIQRLRKGLFKRPKLIPPKYRMNASSLRPASTLNHKSTCSNAPSQAVPISSASSPLLFSALSATSATSAVKILRNPSHRIGRRERREKTEKRRNSTDQTKHPFIRSSRPKRWVSDFESLRRRIVDDQEHSVGQRQPLHQDGQKLGGDRFGIASDALQEVIIVGVVGPDADGPQPGGDGPSTAGEQHAGDDRRQSPRIATVQTRRQPTHPLIPLRRALKTRHPWLSRSPQVFLVEP